MKLLESKNFQKLENSGFGFLMKFFRFCKSGLSLLSDTLSIAQGCPVMALKSLFCINLPENPSNGSGLP